MAHAWAYPVSLFPQSEYMLNLMTTSDLTSSQLILGSLSWRFLSLNADPEFQERNTRIRNLSLTQGTNPTHGLLTTWNGRETLPPNST